MTAPTTAISPTADTTSRVRSVHRRRGAGDTEAEESGAEESDETEGPEEIKGADETEGADEIEESDETEAAEEGVGAGPGTGAGVSSARRGTPSGRYFPFTARYPPGLIR
ncbi:hypothetical protein [Streptomyces lydicus]|uniref:hypothetical protein n=1 Tax=Streptomyces lydicus TaxID=47763 RepID=UPI0034227E1F